MSKKIFGFGLAFCLGLICWEIVSQCRTIFFETNKTKTFENSPAIIKTLPQTPNFQDTEQSTRNGFNQVKEVEDKEIWVTSDIEECLSKVNVKEPIKVASYFNPFYLRANFDGNNSIDYAVLIQGQTAKKEEKVEKMNGLVICKDRTKPFVFGAVSKPQKQLTSMENDNFITDDWEIMSKEEARTPKAKGEVIGFFFEGGDGIYVYWDGKAFQVVE
jgi:hypothetical protein